MILSTICNTLVPDLVIDLTVKPSTSSAKTLNSEPTSSFEIQLDISSVGTNCRGVEYVNGRLKQKKKQVFLLVEMFLPVAYWRTCYKASFTKIIFSSKGKIKHK